MHIQEHVITTIPVFEIKDTFEKVLEFFQDTTYSHVAIVEEGRFLGVFSEIDAEVLLPGTRIEEFRYELQSFFVRAETNWLDVLEAFARNEANILPILNEKEEVVGYYDLTDIVTVFIDTPFFTDPGSILVVATGIKDYSFSQIAQIVESNNAKLLGGFITDTQNDIIQVTLKITTENFNKVVQTFRRYNYHILFGNSDDQFLEDLKERSDYLDKYLNV
ncbi:CBS domain-containing protein [Maribacter orientalis]|uniref:CBS domain-containing protein n=1 Tax=Maribacter orientalis TaxID=228957 RepID=A0A1H7QQ22_9FLAO|nr:CBS domain-containing protein [Maribacter orientalis]SEL50076.1 CBS domain-containing protein [Maribacter orientalis]|tara:strand:- start:1471 stop:2127 length:657 start_codon:yes stop_codon:yes gene_type:complete